MAGSINHVHVLGNVGQAPEVRVTGSGVKVANFSVATQNWNDETEWHRIVAWDKLAELIERFVNKGDQIFVSGRLEYNDWTDKEGNRRITAEIRAEDVTFLGRRQVQASAPAAAPTATDEELPF